MPKNKPIKVLSENANLVATDRYFMENENWNDLSIRVGSLVASVENDRCHYSDLFSEIIYDQLFLPAGRILRNAGRPKGSLFNCYVLPIGDSIDEIAQFYKESLILWSEGGGVGCNFSPLRPKGAKILGKGGISSGLVSFIQASNDISMVVESGGSRRAAAMGVCSIYHPEVLDFIDAKIEHGKISQYNISVGIDDKFIEAVEADKEWTFRFKQQEYGSMSARKIWDKIIKNMLDCAEPGLLNMSNLTKNNSYYFCETNCTNPCLTGDTLIHVADGRNHVSFKQLAEKGKDVPVYTLNKDNKIEIQTMLRPRCTGVKKILKVKFKEGQSIRCTENHKFRMIDGTYKEASQLQPNDRLAHVIKNKNKISNNTISAKVLIKDIDNKVHKTCEYCGKSFDVDWKNREICFDSSACAAKYKEEFIENNINNQENLMVMNYKVESIEEDGFEEVYNGTVENTHNYFAMVGTSLTKSGNTKYNYVNQLNCGEVPLEPYGVCCLGSLVLPNFITGNVNTNWKKLEETIKIAVRFLDNVIDCNNFVLKENDIAAHNSRRIGLGVLGLSEYFFAKGIRYGSEKSIQEAERLMKFIRDVSYETSVELAIEKGSFPKFDSVHYGKASFVRKLPASLRMSIKKNGIRNVTLNAVAPTGTIALLCDYTGGIEPLFSKAFERRDKISNRIIVHERLRDHILNNPDEDIPDWFVDSYDLKPQEHLEMQSIIQQYVDSSVSKTINLPEKTSSEELSEWLLTYIPNLKGTTVYMENCLESQVYNSLSLEEAKEYVLKNESTSNVGGDDFRCKSGTCDL